MTRSFISIISLIGFAALTGCTTTSGEVKLGVDVAALGRSDTATDDVTTSPDLTLDRVRVLVKVAKIGYAGRSEDSAEAGPTVIELTADEIANGAHRELSLGSLPTGTYSGAEIEIDSVDDVGDSEDASLREFVNAGASVLIDGTYKGAEFSFAGHFLAEQGTDGEVTVDEKNPVMLAMTVDPSTWFLDSSSSAQNPADAALHDALAVSICKTLDTQPQLASAGDDKGGHPGHGGGDVHCVER